MALNLKKNAAPINLTKSAPTIKSFEVGLQWDGDDDLDASVILLDADGRFVDAVSYAHGFEKMGIKHTGDARDGEQEGDDESMTINLDEVPDNIASMVVTITSHVDEGDAVMFGAATNPTAYLRGNGNTLIEAKLDQEAAFGTAVTLVEFTRKGSEWEYKNVSETVGSSPQGLADILAKYP